MNPTIAQNNAAILGQERISKLLRLYAIPSIISMLVNALYRYIVDQIFIGWGVGYLGNGATNIVSSNYDRLCSICSYVW